jgi:hypothetical protein
MTISACAVHIPDMKTTLKTRTPTAVRRLALLCIACSGGCRDANGAYTVCALCELQGAEVPEPAAA